MPDPAARKPIRDANGRFLLTGAQVADALSTAAGRQELGEALTGKTPVDLARLGDPEYLRTLDPADIADHWSEITAASDQIAAAAQAAKGTR